MANGRCRMHGGKSTGPRTPEGLERSRKANWKHGKFSGSAITDRRQAAIERRRISGMLDSIVRSTGIPSSRSLDKILTLLELADEGKIKLPIGLLARLGTRLFNAQMAFEKKMRERNTLDEND